MKNVQVKHFVTIVSLSARMISYDIAPGLVKHVFYSLSTTRVCVCVRP